MTHSQDFSTSDVCRLTGWTPSTVLQAIKDGTLHGFRLTPRGRWRIPATEYHRIEAVIERGRRGAAVVAQ